MTPISHITGNWSVIAAIVGGLGLIIAVVRYKIPELTKKVEAMERTEYPTKQDLEVAIESFRTVCKFNQVTCQKGVNCQINKVREDLDGKLSQLYVLINKQAIIIARVDERVASMHKRHDHLHDLIAEMPQRMVNDQ